VWRGDSPHVTLNS